jgi:uncharacterized membrane protein YhhN
METISLLAFFVFAGLDWYAVSLPTRTLEYVAKPAALAALIVFASTGPAASPLLIAALCLGLLGDVYLMLPVDLFLPGLGAFLVGHLAYIADFDASVGWRLVWFAVMVAATYPVSRRIVKAVSDGTLRVAIMVYLGVISFMAASAIASGSFAAAIGAVLFVASDAIIAWDRFVGQKSWARVAIIVTYHLGQLGIVYALRA